MENSSNQPIGLKENAKEITQKDFNKAVELSQIFREGVKGLDRKLFDFKIAFAGFLGIVLTIIFANIQYFNRWFPFSILTIAILTFATLFIELWQEAASEIPKLDEWDNEVVMMANIRNTATIKSEVRLYGIKAQERYSEKNKLYQAMKAGKSIEDILKELGSKRKWKLRMAWWGFLFLSVPLIFLAQLLYMK